MLRGYEGGPKFAYENIFSFNRNIVIHIRPSIKNEYR